MSLPGNLAMYAVGAIVGPYVASVLIEANGRSAMFLMIAAAHVLVIRSGIARRRARPSPGARTARS